MTLDYRIINMFWFCTYLVLTYVLIRLLEVKLCRHHHAEPPMLRSRIPFLGHLLGLVRFGVSYYRMLREDNDLPVFTMLLASQKVYVVNSPTIVSQIYRRPNMIDSNPPFLKMIFEKLFAFHDDDLKVLSHGSLRQDTKVLEHGMLERGTTSMNDIYHSVMTSVAKRLEILAVNGPETIRLQDWLQTILPLATADGLFGPNNPATRSHTFLDRFWEFDGGLKGLTMSPFPSFTARGPTQARRSLVLDFEDFIENLDNTDSDGVMCDLLRQTADLARYHGRDTEYIARYFFAVYTAFVINAIPVAFWTISQILQNPKLLAAVRKEVFVAVTLYPDSHSRNQKSGLPQAVLDIVMLRKKCPLLRSTLQEVLRHVAASISTLVVKEDTLINNEFLFKKGALVQIAATAIHSDTKIWGPNAANFDADRPLQNKARQIHPSAYRMFGGGSNLCPGRHLACDEILTVTAMFLYTFDAMVPEGSQGLPPRNTTDMLSVMKPVRDITLVLRRRSGIGPLRWRFQN